MKLEAEKRREALIAEARHSQNVVQEMQQLAEASTKARTHFDEVERDLSTLKTKLSDATDDHGRRKEVRLVRQLREHLKQREKAKADAERASTATRARFTAATQVAEQTAADLADKMTAIQGRFAQAERVGQCAAEAQKRSAALAAEAQQLHATFDEKRRKIEREISTTLISDVADFAKRHPPATEAANEIALLVLQLKNALNAGEVESLSQAREHLRAALEKVDGWPSIREAAEQRRADAVRAELNSAVAKAGMLVAFVDDYVRSNLTSDAVESLLDLRRDLRNALDYPGVDTLAKAIEQSHTGLAKLALTGEYQTFLTKHLELVTTDRNRFLIEGPADETVVFVNDTGRAPVIRSLKGDLVFDDQAKLCFLHVPDKDLFMRLQIKGQVRAQGAHEVAIADTQCDERLLDQYDLLAVHREDLLNGSMEVAQKLLNAIDNNEWSKIAVLSGRDVDAARDAERVLRDKLSKDIEQAQIDGYGIVYINNGSFDVCNAAEGLDEVHGTLIGRSLERLEVEFKAGPEISGGVFSIDDAFRAAKRRQCGAIYASARDLNDLLRSLTRDKVEHRLMPVWFTQEEVGSVTASVDENMRRGEQRAQEVRRLHEEIQRDKAFRTDQLRSKYGAEARAMEQRIFGEVNAYVRNPANQGVGIRQKFPALATWYEHMLRDNWELDHSQGRAVTSELQDYGKVVWNGRVLEAAFIEAKIALMNREGARRQEQCFDLGYIYDREFEVAREPIGISCDNDTIGTRHRERIGFHSSWIAE
jgi:hypothetical protein